jgi:anhydro-N-acetylmuramic acid kinase
LIARPSSMVVAGVMSGTSADGVDVALCRIAPGARPGDPPHLKFLGHFGMAYPRAVLSEVMRAMEAHPLTAAELSRLNWRLGEIYADAVARAAEKFGIEPALVGMHGQTVHHEPNGVRALGAVVRSTWQIGEAAVVAERLRTPVVSDFRPTDLASGGQGAPLVPMLDWCMFRSKTKGRVLLNLGGIANMTAIPAGGGLGDVTAFDSGPANMVIDGCMKALYGRRFDRNGAVARRGQVLREIVTRVMRERYFPAPPPKSCGREEFGSAFVTRFIAMCRAVAASDADVVTTATALTAESVVEAYRRFVAARLGATKAEVLVAGGGVRNPTLMGMLREGFRQLGVPVRVMEEVGMPAQAKEAAAFALLAWLTWHGLPGNVPAATGASRAVVLGKVSFG